LQNESIHPSPSAQVLASTSLLPIITVLTCIASCAWRSLAHASHPPYDMGNTSRISQATNMPNESLYGIRAGRGVAFSTQRRATGRQIDHCYAKTRNPCHPGCCAHGAEDLLHCRDTAQMASLHLRRPCCCSSIRRRHTFRRGLLGPPRKSSVGVDRLRSVERCGFGDLPAVPLHQSPSHRCSSSSRLEGT
jgi:hypothetical protein